MDIYWLYQLFVRINPTAAGRTGVGAVFPLTNSILSSLNATRISKSERHTTESSNHILHCSV